MCCVVVRPSSTSGSETDAATGAVSPAKALRSKTSFGPQGNWWNGKTGQWVAHVTRQGCKLPNFSGGALSLTFRYWHRTPVSSMASSVWDTRRREASSQARRTRTMGATNKKTQVLYGSFWLGLGFKVKGALFISFMRNVANIPYEVEESNLISLPWSNQFLYFCIFTWFTRTPCRFFVSLRLFGCWAAELGEIWCEKGDSCASPLNLLRIPADQIGHRCLVRWSPSPPSAATQRCSKWIRLITTNNYLWVCVGLYVLNFTGASPSQMCPHENLDILRGVLLDWRSHAT